MKQKDEIDLLPLSNSILNKTINWNKYKSSTITKSLDTLSIYGTRSINLGKIRDFVNNYYVETNNFYYTLITHETYISPNYNPDDEKYHYWPHQLIYNFNTNKDEKFRIEKIYVFN